MCTIKVYRANRRQCSVSLSKVTFMRKNRKVQFQLDCNYLKLWKLILLRYSLPM